MQKTQGDMDRELRAGKPDPGRNYGKKPAALGPGPATKRVASGPTQKKK